MKFETSLKKTADGVRISAQIKNMAPFDVDLTRVEFEAIEASRPGYWREWVTTLYIDDLRTRAAIRGVDVLSLVDATLAPRGPLLRRVAVYAAGLVALLASLFGLKALECGSAEALQHPEFWPQRRVISAIEEGEMMPDAAQAALFRRCQDLRLGRAIPIAVLVSSTKPEGAYGTRQAVAAAREFLSSFSPEERRASCVENLSLVGGTVERLLQRLDEVTAP